jgi:methylated-DNA-[protein]-cysteine S-methyltransferase
MVSRAIPVILENAGVLATLTHPNHLADLSSWGFTRLPPTCISNDFGYNSIQHDSYQAVLASPIPAVPFVAIRIERGELSAIDFLQHTVPTTQPVAPATALALARLNSYFSGGLETHSPIQPVHGTPFQHRVWQLLQQIPAGETRRYGELAAQLGSSARAVAGACRANPLPILIPCHRVVAADGIGGYMGQTEGEGVAIKRWLLHHEGHV